MAQPKNNWHVKREIQFMPAHNRKAGSAKWWKQKNSRKRRRSNRRQGRETVENIERNI